MNSTPPWLKDVKGTQVLPLIEDNHNVICVEAGPGTGKTYGLVKRIIRIVHPDGLNINPKDVLVVAFNRVIAKQLNEDIENILKEFPNIEIPTIRTVHALCLEFLSGNIRILLPHERKAMIYEVNSTSKSTT